MSTEQGGNELDPVSFEPLPRIITAFSADASPFEALAETVDNAIDYARARAYEGNEPEEDLKIRIEFNVGDSQEDSHILIEDNAGGVASKNLSRFFQWGRSVTAPESIGRFGVGASRVAALGQRLEYQSRSFDQDVGHGFEVDVAEMETHEGDVTEDTYRAERRIIEDLEEGHSRVVVKNLRRGISSILAIDQTSDSESGMESSLNDVEYDTIYRGVPIEEWESGLNRMANQFGDVFELFITEGIDFEEEWFEDIETTQINVDIELTLNIDEWSYSTDASTPDPVEYSYLPFDNLGPRKYLEIPFDENESVDPSNASVRADILVGLMTRAEDEKAGLTLIANGRKILSRDTTNPLFSSDYLGAYRAERGHGRISITVEMKGKTEDMPINSLKSDFDMNSPIADPLLRITKNAARFYWKQDYTKMPDWVLRPYDQNDEFAAHGGRIIEYYKGDSSINSARFRRQPGESDGRRSFIDRDRIRAKVKVHRSLRITDREALVPTEGPAYNYYMDNRYDVDTSNYRYAPSVPIEMDGQGPELDWDDVNLTVDDDAIDIVAEIIRMAKHHAQNGGRVDELDFIENWQLPRYHEELKSELNVEDLENSDLELWINIPDTVLLEELDWVVAEFGPDITRADIEEFSAYPLEIYEEVFTNIEEALSQLEQDYELTARAETKIESGDSSEWTSPPGPGIGFNDEYYQVENEEVSRVLEIIELDEDASPEEFWSQLLKALEDYDAVKSRFLE